MPSASATEDPPYFCTTSATGAPLLPGLAAGRTDCWPIWRLECTYPGEKALRIFSRPSRRARPGQPGGSRLGALLGHVEHGVGQDGVQRPEGRGAVGAPVVHIGVLLPPQGLQRAPS